MTYGLEDPPINKQDSTSMTYGLEDTPPTLLIYPSVDRAEVSSDGYPKTKDSLRRFRI